jgi:hypothetical protein
MSKARSKIDAVAGARRLKNAINTFRGESFLVLHLLTYAAFIEYISPPPCKFKSTISIRTIERSRREREADSIEHFSGALVSTESGKRLQTPLSMTKASRSFNL